MRHRAESFTYREAQIASFGNEWGTFVRDNEESFPTLRHTEVDGVEQELLHSVAKLLKLYLNLTKVLLVAIHHSSDVLKQCQSWLALPDGCEKGRKSITVIAVSVLESLNAEGLAWRPADYCRNPRRQ